MISTVTIPGPTVVGPGETIQITQPGVAPAPQTITSPPQTITVQAPPSIVTVSPPPPVCSETGLVAVSDSAGCSGRDCQIEYFNGAAVHWVNKPTSVLPPLVTVLTFLNEAARQTCITTSCNTEVFNNFYRQTFSNCGRPPCPTNTIDCNCNIVVGPIVLPGDKTTSAHRRSSQIGPSGWNLNLGPTATARDVGLCSAGGPQCVTEQPRALSTPLVYTGDVGSTTVTNNGTGAVATKYLLHGIGDYFPPGDPFGDYVLGRNQPTPCYSHGTVLLRSPIP